MACLSSANQQVNGRVVGGVNHILILVLKSAHNALLRASLSRAGFGRCVKLSKWNLFPEANRRNYINGGKPELGPKLAFALPSLPYSLPDWGSFIAAWIGRSGVSTARVAPSRSVAHSIVAHSVVGPAPARLRAPDQWAKLNGILARAVGGADAARQLQASATQQLDLAQYGLTTLVDELSAIMTIPGRQSRTATLHVIGAGIDVAVTGTAHGHRRAMAA